jgi:hypothetical protein
MNEFYLRSKIICRVVAPVKFPFVCACFKSDLVSLPDSNGEIMLWLSHALKSIEAWLFC